jgi:biotin operon repressor
MKFEVLAKPVDIFEAIVAKLAIMALKASGATIVCSAGGHHLAAKNN